MVASGSRAAFRQPLQLRGGFKGFKVIRVVRVVRDLNDSDNGKLLRSTFAIFFTEYSSYMWLKKLASPTRTDLRSTFAIFFTEYSSYIWLRPIYSRSVMTNKFGITLGLFVYLQ